MPITKNQTTDVQIEVFAHILGLFPLWMLASYREFLPWILQKIIKTNNNHVLGRPRVIVGPRIASSHCPPPRVKRQCCQAVARRRPLMTIIRCINSLEVFRRLGFIYQARHVPQAKFEGAGKCSDGHKSRNQSTAKSIPSFQPTYYS